MKRRIHTAAVIAFIASAAVWTVLPWHKSDYKKAYDEEGVRHALKGADPGLYTVPHCPDPASLQDEEVRQKFIDGPQAFITVVPNGLPQMAPKLVMSFLYNVLVGVLCAYFVSRTLDAEASYLAVFRISGTVAWIAYGIAYIQDSIWFGRPWAITMKALMDALIYGLLAGGVFGWLV